MLNQDDIAVIGVCSDHNSSYLRGPAKAPDIIRQSLFSGSANLCSELGVEITKSRQYKDLGNLDIHDNNQSFLGISDHITKILDSGAKPFVLGGDHSITYPVFKSMFEQHGPIHILHFDAHPDLYHNFEDNQYSHASPFARIMEQNLANRLVQVGIRTINQHQQEQAEKYKVEQIEMKALQKSRLNLNFDGPVYITFDIDALDPAFAPGVSHHEPGGLSVRDAITIIQDIDVPVLGADIVEYNPARDINQMTAMVAAKLMKEIIGKML